MNRRGHLRAIGIFIGKTALFPLVLAALFPMMFVGVVLVFIPAVFLGIAPRLLSLALSHVVGLANPGFGNRLYAWGDIEDDDLWFERYLEWGLEFIFRPFDFYFGL